MEVKVQTDEEIPIHIFNIIDKESAKLEEEIGSRFKSKKRGKRAPRTMDLGLTVNQKENQKKKKIELEAAVEEEEAQYKPMTIDHDKENVDLTGKSMFSFQQLSKKSTSTMMGKVLNEENKGGGGRTTTAAAANKRHKNTNVLNKKRVEQRLASLKDDANSSNEEDDDESDEEEEEDEGEEFVGLRKKAKKSLFDETDGYERYFQDLHGSSKTSNNTLSKLQVLEPQEFHQLLKNAPKKHNEEVEFLATLHKQNFAQWQFELQSGFNLVFYGFGSKRNLLNDFSKKVLTDGPLIVVNGFFPSISIKDILLKITAGALEHTAPLGQIQDHVNFICDYFKQEDRVYECLYLVVHNLDGPSLRNERAQTALSMLASCPNIHFIASVDHINAGLLWDNAKSRRFNWIWHDITTYDDYLVETSFENSLLIRSGEVGGSRGIQYVLASLTANARGVFKILAEHQLLEMEMANMEGKANESVGLSYGQYYQKCREGFFVSNDLTLRTELTEFRDHKIISTRKSPDGTEFFFIPLDKATLLSIIENMI